MNDLLSCVSVKFRHDLLKHSPEHARLSLGQQKKVPNVTDKLKEDFVEPFSGGGGTFSGSSNVFQPKRRSAMVRLTPLPSNGKVDRISRGVQFNKDLDEFWMSKLAGRGSSRDLDAGVKLVDNLRQEMGWITPYCQVPLYSEKHQLRGICDYVTVADSRGCYCVLELKNSTEKKPQWLWAAQVTLYASLLTDMLGLPYFPKTYVIHYNPDDSAAMIYSVETEVLVGDILACFPNVNPALYGLLEKKAPAEKDEEADKLASSLESLSINPLVPLVAKYASKLTENLLTAGLCAALPTSAGELEAKVFPVLPYFGNSRNCKSIKEGTYFDTEHSIEAARCRSLILYLMLQQRSLFRNLSADDLHEHDLRDFFPDFKDVKNKELFSIKWPKDSAARFLDNTADDKIM